MQKVEHIPIMSGIADAKIGGSTPNNYTIEYDGICMIIRYCIIHGSKIPRKH